MKRSSIFVSAAGFISAAILVFLASGTPGAQGSEPETASPYGDRGEVLDLKNAYQPPMVYADAVDISSSSDGRLKGSFALINDTEDALSDIGYRIEVFGDPLGEEGSSDPQVLFGRMQSDDVFALVSKERMTIPFEFTLPSLPKGAYTAQVQILQTGGRKLGWGRAPLIIEKGASNFAYLYQQSIVLPEFENKEVHPLTGPNVDPEGSLIFTASVEHAQSSTKTLTPVLEWHEFDESRPVTDTVSFNAVSVAAGEESLLTLPVKAPAKPGVYMGMLTLRDGNRVVSTLGQYRIVVRGAAADLISARLATAAVKKGETVFARIDYVGAADAETRGTGQLKVELRDADGVAGSLLVPEIRLTDGVGRGTARIELTRDLTSEPNIHVVISDTTGNVLRDASVPVALTAAQIASIQNQSSWHIWTTWYTQPYYLTWAFAIAVFLAITAMTLRTMIRHATIVRKSLRALSSAMMIGVLLFMQSPFASAFGGSNGIEVFTPITVGENENYTTQNKNDYRAYWSEIYTQPSVALFVNRPVHNSTYQCNTPIPLEYRIEFAACDNMPSGGRVLAHFDLNQNFQNTLLGTGANWVKVYDQPYNQPANCSTHACIHSYSQNTTVDLNAYGLPSTATRTTLRVVVKHNPYLNGAVAFPDDTVSYSDFYFSHRVVQAFNIWLNFVCAQPKADIQIVKSAVTPSVNQGNQASYGISVRNNGPDTANNVVVTDQIPNGLTFISSSDNRCAQQGGNIVCNFGNMVNNAQIQATFTFQTSTATVCGNVPNVASVQTSTQDDNQSNNTSTASIQVNCPVQIGCIDIMKEAFDANNNQLSVVPQFTFTLDGNTTVVNDSTGRARINNVSLGNHTVTESLPSGWQLVQTTPANGALTVAAGPQCALVTFRNRQVPPQTGCIDIVKEVYDASGNILPVVPQFTFTLDGNTTVVNNSSGNARFTNVPAGSHTVTETLTSGWQQQLVTPVNGVVTVPVSNQCVTVVFKNRQVVQQTPDVSIVKAGPATISRGNILTYTLTVFNGGNAPANNVSITDHTPSGLTFVPASSDSTCSLQSASVVCNLGTVNAGASRAVILSFSVPSTQPCADILNQATVSASNDGNLNNNTSGTVTTQVSCQTTTGCIDIIKTTLNTVGNVLTPTAQFTFTLDGSQTTQNDSTGRARFNNISVGSHTITEVVPSGWTMTSMSPVGGVVNVVASANNSSCSQVYVLNQQNSVTVNADLAIVKTGPSTALRGSSFSYQLNVTNNGPQSASNVVVTDQLPSELVYLPGSSDSRCTVSGQTVTCQLGTMTSGQQTSLTIGVLSSTVSGTCSQTTITNRATVTSSTPDSNQSNNSSQMTTTFTCPSVDTFCPDVSIDTDDNEVDAGDEIDYEIRVRNNTNQSQTFDLTAFLDRDTDFVDASGNADDHNSEVNWDNVTISANSSKTFDLTVETDNDLNDGDSVRLRVETNCDSDSEETDIRGERVALGEANLTIDKSVDRNEALPGDILSYTLTVRNTGSASINDVVVDDIHTSNRLTIFSAPGGTISGNSIHWNLGTMARGAVRILHYTASVSLDAQNGDLIPNTATVTAPGQRASDSEFVHVLRILPQTGAFNGTLTPVTLMPILGNQSSGNSMPWFASFIVALVGTAGGAFATKKFLF